MKEIYKKIIPQKYHEIILEIKTDFLDGYSTKSYSQEGEDMILRRLFEGKQRGFYVDIGAHHPKRFSNTYFFYKRGWRGINIDPMPGSMKLFNKARARDINLECGIFESEDELTYYIFREGALNTFSSELAHRLIKNNWRLIKKAKVKVYPLHKILNEYIDERQKLDFMSIDVEGLELSVLNSNDWEKYRPTILLIEGLNFDMFNLNDSPLYSLMRSLDFRLVAKTVNTLFFEVNT